MSSKSDPRRIGRRTFLTAGAAAGVVAAGAYSYLHVEEREARVGHLSCANLSRTARRHAAQGTSRVPTHC